MPVALTAPGHRRDLARFFLDDLTRVAPLRGEPGLVHARRFFRLLGNPQDHARQVHVVGTAGKGTTATAITRLVAAADTSVATHLSPHVYDLRERFLVDGELVGWDEVLDAAGEVYTAATRIQDEVGRPPSFFAATAALAWALGRRAGVDLMVTEAGIGGRYDATNVIRRPDKITVITNIGLDHADVLGTDLSSIARQKADVIAPDGVAIVGPQSHPEVVDVVARVAAGRNARLVAVDQSVPDWRQAATAVAAAVARELGIEPGSTPDRAGPPGRGELWIVDGRRVVLDGAHNPLKLTALFEGLAREFPDELESALGLIAIGAGKDLDACADVIAAHLPRVVVTAFGDGGPAVKPRSRPTGEVAVALVQRRVEVVDECEALEAAADLAYRCTAPRQMLVVTGSFFHLADIRRHLIEQARDASQVPGQASVRPRPGGVWSASGRCSNPDRGR